MRRAGGAVLIVVMALLGTLTFLGFLFYTFAAQEQVSATYFSQSETPAAKFPPSLYEDWFLEQLTLGTRHTFGGVPGLADSALYGSNWALIPNMIGRPLLNQDLSLADGAGNYADVNPYDGLGIGVWANASTLATLSSGQFFFDYEGDGEDDASGDFLNQNNFGINFSLAANAGFFPPQATAFHPDAGYTYPDVNSLFLAFDGYVRDPNNPNDIYRVIIPSFHRPQYFPAGRGGVDGTIFGSNPNGFSALYTAPATANQVLRPHREHRNAADPTLFRFLRVPTLAASGDTTRTIPPFPFQVNINGDAVSNQAGVWSVPRRDLTPAGLFNPNDPSSTVYEFDVDTDGDGFRDAIWMDLDFPILDLPDGRQFVPMFACKVIDADGLLNVNAHGNMNGILARQWDGDVILPGDPTTEFVSSSNQALSRSEINLGMALTGDPDPTAVPRELFDDPNLTDLAELAAAQDQLELNFGTGIVPTGVPLSQAVLSNLELLNLLTGREKWRNDPVAGFVVESKIEGRWGDDFRIADFYNWIRSGGTFPGAPSPGGYLIDDDGDSNMIGISPVFNAGTPPYSITLPAGFSPDDDINAPVGHAGGGAAYRDPDLLGTWVPPFVHPLDYGGTGGGYVDSLGGIIRRRLQPVTSMTNRAALQLGMDNPAAFPTYFGVSPTLLENNYWQYQFVSTDAELLTALSVYHNLFGNLPYYRALQPDQTTLTLEGLQELAVGHDFLRDDGGEVILDRRFRNPEYDAVFPAYEMEPLHLRPSDYTKLKTTSRLRELVLANLDKMNDDVGSLIRSRLTTDSWDRLEFAQGQSVTGTSVRDWEFTTWNYNDPPPPGNPNAAEFQTTVTTFPPEFVDSTAATQRFAAGEIDDPIRQELRLLLKSEFADNAHLNPNSGAARPPRHRLNINRVLSDESFFDPSLAAFDANENPRFRNLTPHPNMSALEEINTGTTIPTITIPEMEHRNLPFGTAPSGPPFADLSIDPLNAAVTDAQRAQLATAMEWWARYDRQRLARDIYTMLYLLGNGDDTLDVTRMQYPVQDSNGNMLNDYQEEMAQFAVNLVDAMDRDDVITRFEYDEDLSDGWNPTGMIFKNGVEAQALTISEALWIETLDQASNNSDTFWPDDDPSNLGRHFIYIELRNNSPFDVTLYDDAWRIRRLDSTGMVDQAIVEFEQADSNIIKGGRNFIISGSDNSVLVGGEFRASDFYVDFDSDAEFEAIVPWRVDDTDMTTLPTDETNGHPAPLADIDLSYQSATGPDHTLRYNDTLRRGVGVLLDQTTDAAVNEMVLVLERRRNPHNDGHFDFTGMPSRWEDWVEVDRFNLMKTNFDPNPSGMATLEQHLGTVIKSTARSEPLNRLPVGTAFNHNLDGTSAARSHSIGNPTGFLLAMKDLPNDPTNLVSKDRNQGNDPGNDPFTIWQPHFDRDFSSVFELLAVPVIAPSEVTEKLVDTTTKKLTGWFDESILTDRKPALAGARFRDVDPNNDSDASMAATLDDDNRWYRLLEFLTVPDGGDEAIRERLTRLIRTPGKVNINTIRDETVLAAILDDAHIERFVGLPFVTNDSFELAAPTVRNWYNELILARDGIDPLNEFGTGLALPLPGVPGVPSDPTGPSIQFGAVPFRSQSYVAPDLGPNNGNIWPEGANQNKTAHTLLRQHVSDDAARLVNRTDLEQLGLFEARPTTDIANDVDYHTRNRLLAKVANHTTNRSNVFAVWLTVGMFEAHQPNAADPTVVQIGGELAGSERHRAFFVIDRTRLEEAVEVDDRGTAATNDDIMTLNWRSLLLHRRSLADD